jgi:hypothetical protein
MLAAQIERKAPDEAGGSEGFAVDGTCVAAS